MLLSLALVLLTGCGAVRGALAAAPSAGPPPTSVGGELTKGISDFVASLLPYLLGIGGIGLAGGGIQKVLRATGAVASAAKGKPKPPAA